MKNDKKGNQYRINEQIHAREVRIVGDDGSTVMPTRHALDIARQQDVDQRVHFVLVQRVEHPLRTLSHHPRRDREHQRIVGVLEDLQEAAYNDQIAQWIADADAKYYPERLQ